VIRSPQPASLSTTAATHSSKGEPCVQQSSEGGEGQGEGQGHGSTETCVATQAQERAVRLLQAACRVVCAVLRGAGEGVAACVVHAGVRGERGGRAACGRGVVGVGRGVEGEDASAGGSGGSDREECSDSGSSSDAGSGGESEGGRGGGAAKSRMTSKGRGSRAGVRKQGGGWRGGEGEGVAGVGCCLEHLEALACGWLDRMLAELPEGCAVTAVTTLQASVGRAAGSGGGMASSDVSSGRGRLFGDGAGELPAHAA